MLKFLMGIVTALLIVVALVIWTTLEGVIPPRELVSPAPNAAGTADTPVRQPAPSAAPEAPTETESLTPLPGGGDTNDGSGTLTPLPGGGTTSSDRRSDAGGAVLAPVAMEQLEIDQLRLKMGVPEDWMRLDKNTMRAMLSNYRGETDPAEIERRVAPIIFWTLPGAPVDGPVPEVIVEVMENPTQDIMQLLATQVGAKREMLDDVQILEGPRQATLGGFEGGMVRTRERIPGANGDVLLDTQIWIFETEGRYVTIIAPAAADDSRGRAIIDAVVGSIARMEGG